MRQGRLSIKTFTGAFTFAYTLASTFTFTKKSHMMNYALNQPTWICLTMWNESVQIGGGFVSKCGIQNATT